MYITPFVCLFAAVSFYTYFDFIQVKLHKILWQELQPNYNTTSIMGTSGILKCSDFTLHKCCFWFPQHMTNLNGTKVPLLQMSITLYHVWFTNTYTSSETMLNPKCAISFLFMKSTPFLL
jgi:hypothetical protein